MSNGKGVPSTITDQPVQKATEGFGLNTLERSAELASVAVAAAAKAEVEAAFIMAIKNPRNEEDSRQTILRACANPIFAGKARYRKPVGGGQFVVGPSIRFAEEMLRAWKNVLTQMTTIYDDVTKRIVKVTVKDLESNLTYSKEITLDKTVERRNTEGREVLGQRVNSNKQIVYIVKATEDELAIKEAAQVSKIIRNSGLRLIPQHITEEAMMAVEKMLRDRVTKDPAAERRALLDGFGRRGIMPSEVERYMGSPSPQWTDEQMVQLRDILTSIEDGQTSWREYVEGTSAEAASEMEAKSQPETKGAAILDKIGKPADSPTPPQPAQPPATQTEPPKPSAQPKEEPKPKEPETKKAEQAKKAEPKAEPKTEPKAEPKKAPPAVSMSLPEINDSSWADIIGYLDDDPKRAVLKKGVREKGNWGLLTELKNPKRAQFLLSLQDAAKQQGIELQTFIQEA